VRQPGEQDRRAAQLERAAAATELGRQGVAMTVAAEAARFIGQMVIDDPNEFMPRNTRKQKRRR
jgi:hypothetical protein